MRKTRLTLWLGLLAAVVIISAAVLIGLQLRARPHTAPNSKVSDSKKQAAAGMAAFRRGEFAAAVSKLQVAARLNPKNAEAQSGLGRSLEATGKLDEAAGAYRASLAVKPDQPDVLYNLAIIHKSQGKNQEAVAELEKAIKLNEQFVGARVILGDLYAQLDKNDKAREQYQTVLDLKPFGVDLSRIQKKLGALK